VSRLYDRVLAEGCEPLDARRIHEYAIEDAERPDYQKELSRALGREATDDEVSSSLQIARDRLRQDKSEDVLGANEIKDAVVVAAEYSLAYPA
jgi:hypothetical protein